MILGSSARMTDALIKRSKHSHYQALHPKVLSKLTVPSDYRPKSLLEAERDDFTAEHLSYDGARVADIGANTGYFSIAALERGAASVDAYEGNPQHAAFLRDSAELLRMTDVLQVHERYVTFEPYDIPEYDISICYNVLHHLGDDFRSGLTLQQATEAMSQALRTLVTYSRTCLFQMGFNWKGNRALPLTKEGTKSEIIEFVRASLSGLDAELVVGCFVPETGTYQIAGHDNLPRFDDLGEFLNRPIFVIRRVGATSDDIYSLTPKT